MNEIHPNSPTPSSSPTTRRPYRPWSRARVWVLFMFGMHAAGCMTFFFHPIFAVFGFAFGLPAVILAAIEIREYPEARFAGPVRWGRITGLIGAIGGPVSLLLFGILVASLLSLFGN